MTGSPFRLCYLVSHPIQYQAPLLRRIADDPEIQLTVLFETLETAAGYHDEGFGRDVVWDVPLTEGYPHQLVSGIDDMRSQLAETDVLWVHGWDSRLRRKALALAARIDVPVLMRGENTLAAMPDGAGLRGMAKRHYLKVIFKHCAGFLCIGSQNRRYYEEHGVADDRLFSMPYAVDNDFFIERGQTASVRRKDFRRELNLQPDRPVVLFAGKLQQRKHPMALLQAWRNLDAQSAGHPYLLFVGDGEERAALEASIGDDEGVRVLGFRNQTELPAFYDLADIFVLPSEREPWGLSVNEAMACGTAIIASDQCGCAADLVDDSCGAVVAAGDSQALAEALQTLLGDAERLATMGEAARKRIASCSYNEDVTGLKAAIKAVCPAPGKA
jgi:glycosyltransferase involved in cell wall biosynthesis